jgi:transposase-like protein
MRVSRDDRQAHVELWRGSGLSRAEYCRRAGLAYHQLTAWLRSEEQRGAEDGTGADGFVLVDLPTAAEPAFAGEAVLELGQGGRVRFTSGCAAAWVGRVLAEVTRC